MKATNVIPKVEFYSQLEETKNSIRGQIVEFIWEKSCIEKEEAGSFSRIFEELKRVIPAEKKELLFELEAEFNTLMDIRVQKIISFLLENTDEIKKELLSF